MCVENPVSYKAMEPVNAYKTMAHKEGKLISLLAGNTYHLGQQYPATHPELSLVQRSRMYDVGFHAYKEKIHAERKMKNVIFHQSIMKEQFKDRFAADELVLVEVELSDIMFEGVETMPIPFDKNRDSPLVRMNPSFTNAPVLVAQTCKFVRIISSTQKEEIQ